MVQSSGSYQAGLPEGFVWNQPKPTKAEAEKNVQVGGASRMEGRPACCHTTLTNTDFQTTVALLAVIEDVPTFHNFSSTNQQDCFSDVLCRCLHSWVKLHPAASLIRVE